jgi:subtilase family serine protease
MQQLLVTLFIAASLIAPTAAVHAFAAAPLDPSVHPPIHVRPAATTSPNGYSPPQIRHAYGFDLLSCTGANTCGTGQTIAIVDAYDDPNAESDLKTFSSTYGLPACTTANYCFSKVYASGSKPRSDQGWSLEISLDVQWAHAIAPGAKILLVEAQNNQLSGLMSAVDVAVSKGAKVVSMSWGSNEFSSETSYDYHFNKAGVAFFASSGDSGSVSYPAASPYVIGVGGTTLHLDNTGNLISAETAWSGGGGGISVYENEPSYQSSYGITTTGGNRGIPDVSYNADPNTGISVYDSVGYQGQKGWFIVGGTSAGSPQWAALAAIAAPTVPVSSALYNAASTTTTDSTTGKTEYVLNYRDITSGSNSSGYSSGPGYDLVTGLGSPLANNLIPHLALSK